MRQQRTTAGIHAVAWRLWWVMSWLLPVALFVRFVLGGGAWVLFVFTGTPLLFVLIAGMLEMTPQLLLRGRGLRASPGPITVLLFVHWWSGVALLLTMADRTLSDETTSLLRTTFHVPISAQTEEGIFRGVAVVAVLSWVAVLVLSIVPRRSIARWDAAAWAAVVAPPLLFAAVVGAAVLATAAEQDSAGDTRITAGSRPVDAQIDLLRERYVQEQAALSTAREVIVPGVWAASQTRVSDEDCGSIPGDCYRIDIGYIFTPEAPIDLDQVRTSLAAAGWEVIAASDDEGSGDTLLLAEDADGRTLRFGEYSHGSYTLDLRSPFWWVSEEAAQRIELGYHGTIATTDDALYAPDKWPALEMGG